MPLKNNASGINLNLCSSFLRSFFNIISVNVGENRGKISTKGNDDQLFISSMSK